MNRRLPAAQPTGALIGALTGNDECIPMLDISSIDWNEVWKVQGLESRKNRGFKTCVDRWSDREQCRKFDRMAKEGNWKRSRDMIARMDIPRGSSVLDVGAGPGTLAIPLARSGCRVTAVEPSPGMVECLRDNVKAEGLDNVRIIPKRWEDVDAEKDLQAPYDVVTASYSLGFDDLRAALQKMNDVAGRCVYIFWFADMKSPWQQTYGDIWERLYDVKPRADGQPNIVFNLLTQMGIFTNVEVFREEMTSRFAGLDEAVADQKYGLNLATPEQEAVLRDYLSGRLQPEDGKYAMRTVSWRMKLWWKKDN